MASETVVLDSSNLPAMIAEATGEPIPPPKPAPVQPKPAKAEVKPETKVEAVEAPKDKGAPTAEELEGLTEHERQNLDVTMQRAIAKRVAKMRQAERQAAQERQGRLAAEERAATAERELAAARAQPKVEPKAAEDPKEPKQEDFDTPEKYVAARVKWEVSQELARERERRRKDEQEAEQARILESAKARIAKAIELVPDFEEVTSEADLSVPPHIAGYMQESEMFAELGYFFAQHPEELERISKLKPGASLVALGKIEGTLKPFGTPEETTPPEPKPEANGASKIKAGTASDGNPSRPRVSVPVIQPLNARGAPEVETPSSAQSGRQAVTSFEKRTGKNLGTRQRH